MGERRIVLNESIQFAVISTPRRLRISNVKDGGDANRWRAVDWLEIDNRGNSRTLYAALNGRTASSALATAAYEGTQSAFRVHPYSTWSAAVKATSVSIVSASTGTTIFVIVGRWTGAS